MQTKKIYRTIRPYLQRAGVLRAARLVTPKSLRERVAVNIGLEGFVPPLPDVRKEGYRGKVRVDGINYIADMRANIGLGESARLIFRALQTASFPVAYQEVHTPAVNRDQDLPPFERRDHPLYGITLAHLIPSEIRYGVEAYPESFKQTYNIGFWLWEVPKLPESWLTVLPTLDEIWTPSTYSQNILSRLTRMPVVYVPIPIEVSLGGKSRKDFGLPEDRFIFLYAFNPTSSVARKNPFGVIEAFRRAFEGMAHPPLLVIKAHHLSAPLNEKVAPKLRAAVDSVGGMLIEDNMSRTEMNDLLQACDCFVSLHRAEGFGLAIAEAMALGKPVIATAYSANTDFMTPSNSFEVGYRLREITEEDHADQPMFISQYEPGQLWAEPDLDHAAELMRYVVDNPEAAQKRGITAQRDIRERWSIQAVGDRMRERLKRLGERRAL